MFALIEAKNYRCLRYVRQSLGPFQVLVGPNASGKTTFLDVISFLNDLVSKGLDEAISARTSSLRDLIWAGAEDRFELAVEAGIPVEYSKLLPDTSLSFFRYEVSIGIDAESSENSILYELGTLRGSRPSTGNDQLNLFPRSSRPPTTIISQTNKKGDRLVFSKKPGQLDNFYPETRMESGSGGWVPAFKLGGRRSVLANLPEDENRFPVATWFKRLLSDGVQQFILNSLVIRRASPPGHGRTFRPDGSNLPWVIQSLRAKSPHKHKEWIEHVRAALPDIEDIKVIERPEDKHCYLVVRYNTGVEVPSWMVSDGTLRLLALTLPAHIPNLTGTYLIEEPENGIHPRAVECVLQSLSSYYDAQVLLTTHSPIILSNTDVDKVLCFAKTDHGETDIVSGPNHPGLRDWKNEESLGVLFASGVLG